TLITLALLVPQAPAAQRADCREWRECRALALEAYANGEYERFHDFAWKAVQTGPPRNADLMYLVARAQSVTGRAHDAFVILGRLAEMGVARDAAANDDFRPVRDLRDWPALEALIAAIPKPTPPTLGRSIATTPPVASPPLEAPKPPQVTAGTTRPP